MVRNLYDLDDRQNRTPQGEGDDAQERPRRILPVGSILIALAIGAGALLLFGTISPASDEKTKPLPSPTVITAIFRFCDASPSKACVEAADRYHYEGQDYRLANIMVPSLTEAKCPQEAQLARDGKRALRAMMNGGSFEARPLPGTDPAGRLLVRDNVSLGALMILKGFARARSDMPINWCDPALG